jgi:hypothetical protein
LRINVDDGEAFTADSETFLYASRGGRSWSRVAARADARKALAGFDGRVSVWLDLSTSVAARVVECS